ncbi:MAG: single-stranded DNA-binding protein [Clostridia bacterium]|nr:single-stranded DNA-binding protein [Clostridia bacterium]
MNKVFLIGNLTKDPELTETSAGVALCRFSIAVNRSYVGANNERKTDFFNCVAWRGLGENIAKYTSKGDKVAVNGSFEQDNYEDAQGVKRTSYTLVVRDIEFLTSHNSQSDKDVDKKLQPVTEDTDIPF